MGSEGSPIDDSGKKHRRSSDAEAEESTKRRKHKHRHHHHHRHHNRSKKLEEVEDEVELDAAVLPPVVPELKKDYGEDDEMEEGEIVEESGVGFGEDGRIVENHLGTSNVDGVDGHDSTVNLRGSLDHREIDEKRLKQGIDVEQAGFGECVNGPDYTKSPDVLSLSNRSGSYYPIDRSGSQSRSDGEAADTLKAALQQNGKHMNDSDSEMSFRNDHSDYHHGRRGRDKDKVREPSDVYSRHGDRRDKTYGKEISHKDLGAGDAYKVHGDDRERDRDMDRRREKERKSSRTRELGKEKSQRNGKEVEELGVNLDEGAKDVMSKSRTFQWDRHRDTEVVSRHRERERDRHRVKEWEKEYSVDRTRTRSGDRGSEWEHSVERTRSKDRGSERERSVERTRSRDRGSERERSVERTRSRDRRSERERSVERVRDRKRDGKDTEHKNKDLSTERDRGKDRVRDRNKDLARERSKEGSYRDRDSRQDRSTDRYWNTEEHLDRNQKYDGGSSNLDRQLEYKRFGNSYSREQDRTKTEDTSRIDVSSNFSGELVDTHEREEEEHEDYQERISLQLAEEEEDDVNRIKEESRRRRQEILEKYKRMKSQDQTEPHSVDIFKGNDQENLSIQQTGASVPSPEVEDDKPDSSFAVEKSPVINGDSAAEHTSTRELGDGSPKSDRSDDMFCDDIFGETPIEIRKTGKGDSLPVERSGLNDNWDDAEGYYSYRFGELLDGRYEITAAHGKGVFSSVVRAKDLKAGKGEPQEVAIKIIRNNDTMFKAGQSELIILNKLVGADPEDRRHCVRFLSSFKYRNHLCLVFESLHMNLREVLKKFGRNIGLKLTAVRVYAKQLLIALKHLRNCGVLHCDIKPDNMLVNESKNVLKLCDFGNAMFAGKNEITPYLVSRFYRAPEIILGLPYDHPVDIWSVGCCLYELYTGKVLFPGATNNDMLRLHMELKGPFPKKMLKKGAFIEQHFDQDLNFLSSEDDPVSKKTVKKVIVNIKPKDIGSIISGSAGEDPKILTNFKDLLDKIFTLDPDKRMTVSQALAHPFITGK